MSQKIEEKIRDYEERLAKTKRNKATQKAINYQKAQLAKLKDQLIKITTSKKGGGSGFGISKHGDAQVAFIGFPSVGKSSLLNLLTEAKSKVASYDFTTLKAIPGMMKIEQANIQLIDLPGIILGASAGKGRGKEILSSVRSADLILILISYQQDGSIDFEQLDNIRGELSDASIRLNKKPARMKIKKRKRGGIGFTYNGKQEMTLDEVKHLMNELGYSNAGVYFSQPNVTPEELIDHVMGNRIYTKEFVVINKKDLENNSISDKEITKIIGHKNWMKISALKKSNIKELKHQIFKELDLIRVFLKPPKEEADMEEPIILPIGVTIGDLCEKLHKTFVRNYRYSLVWGDSAKHPGQKFSKMEHILKDGDVVSIYLRR